MYKNEKPTLKETVKYFVPLMIQQMKKGEYDHHGAFSMTTEDGRELFPAFDVPELCESAGCRTTDAFIFDCIQNDVTNNRISIGIKSTFWYNGEGAAYYFGVPSNYAQEFVEALEELGLKPEFGWEYEGGFRMFTKAFTKVAGYHTEICKNCGLMFNAKKVNGTWKIHGTCGEGKTPHVVRVYERLNGIARLAK